MMPPQVFAPAVVAMVAVAISAVGWGASHVAGSSASNIALHAPYQLDPRPNYDRSMGPKGTELTDGELAAGSFWTSGRSVGWSWRSPVSVVIDLKRVHAVERVRVHTGANTTVGIRYPSQVFVFGGNRAGRFDLLGSSAFARDRDDPERPTTRFVEISFPSRKIDSIVVVAFARGNLIYLSEIEAFAASSGTELPGALGSLRDVRDAAIRERRAAAERVGPLPSGPDKARRWAMPLHASENPIGGKTGEAGAGCTIKRIEPWGTGGPASPTGAQDIQLGTDAPLVATISGADHAAWRIDNWSSRDARVTATSTPDASSAVEVRALSHVQALDLGWVADVAAPFAGTMLPPRSRMLLLADVRPSIAGDLRARISLTCGEIREEIALRTIGLASDTTPLHGTLWSYLHEPAHKPVASALACDAGFHARHGVDTAVVHPAALIDAGRERPGNLLRQYFRKFRTTPRLLLFMDIKSRPWPYRAMADEQAVRWLADWWRWVEENARAENVEGELLLFPVDEAGRGDLAGLTRFRELVKQASIGARIYATIDNADVAGRLDWVEVRQLLEPALAASRSAAGRERHLYGTGDDGRLLSPHRYYRAQGWKAFSMRLDGVGVWSSWDGTGLASPQTGWNPFGAEERDFGLVYVGADGCGWPSRRLLAWRRGIEENRILRHCAAHISAAAMRRIEEISTGSGSSLSATAVIAEVATACAGRGIPQ